MTINLPALPGDKVHVVNDGSREYTGIMLGSFSYRYESSQLIVYVMTDQEADRRDRVGKGPNVIEARPNEISRSNSSGIQILDPLEDGSALDWEFNRKRVLNTAHTIAFRMDDDGIYNTTIRLDSGCYIDDTCLPDDFPNIKLWGYSTIQTDSCYRLEMFSNDDVITEYVYEKIKDDGTIYREARLYDYRIHGKTASGIPFCGIHVGDHVRFRDHNVVVHEMRSNLAASYRPAVVDFVLKDETTGKKFHVTRGLYNVIKPLDLARMTVFRRNKKYDS